MARICIVTGAHLCRNPRVVKEATALREAGHEVVVLGPAWDDALSELDAALVRDGGFEHRVVVDLRPRAGGQRHRHRIVRRLGTEAVVRLGAQQPEALGYGVRRTLAAALRTEADLTIGHQEVGLWVVDRLARRGRRIGADIEDWYSRDLLEEDRARLPLGLLAQLERRVLRAPHVTTTSSALAVGLAEAYDAPLPAVLYNAFPWADRDALDGLRKDREDETRPSLHWVSQTIGPGRGLDVLSEALRQVAEPVDVHLRGNASPETRRWLDELFPSEAPHRLYVHDLVPPEELLSRIAEHDVGLALEAVDPPSRALTVTNKILHYLLGGLAVVATDTPGQREVAQAAPEAVHLCRAGEASSLASAIRHAVEDGERLRRAKAAALAAARERFCWEAQVPTLLRSVEAALSPGPLSSRWSPSVHSSERVVAE